MGKPEASTTAGKGSVQTKCDQSRNTSMKNEGKANRRNVLKAIGTGLAGATVLTGSASAASGDNPDETIVLDNFVFDPRRASVTLDRDDTAVVRWVHKHNVPNAGSPPHDVHLFESDSHATPLVHSGDGQNDDLTFGEIYEVQFSKDGDNLDIAEVTDESNGDTSGTATVNFSGGSVTLHMHCSHHDPGMAGSLTITE